MADVKSTVFDTISQLTANNVNQLFTYNEGDANVDIPFDITFTNLYGYTDNITVTFTFSGGDATFVELVSTNEVATIIKDSDSVYRIESTYTKDGISQNVWADLTTTLSALRLEFNNSDASDDYTIAVAVTNGTDTVNGTITVNGFAVIDADNIVGSRFDADEDGYMWAGINNIWQDNNPPQINDADESGRLYRVTLTSRDPERAAIWCSSTLASPQSTLTDVLTIEGTQANVNAVLADTNGDLFFVTGPDNTSAIVVEYQQEVTSGATGAPYVQETGQFIYGYSTVDGFNTIASNFNYTEDTPMDINVTIGDTRSDIDFFSPITYNATITLTDSAAGSIEGTGWVDAGGGVYTLTGLSGADMITAFTGSNTVFLPATDYNSNTSFDFLLTRNQVQGDPLWFSTNSALLQTLISGNGLTLTATADAGGGYVFDTGPYDWQTDVATDVSSLLNITDRRGDYGTVTYRVYVTLDAPATTTNGEFRTFGSGGTSTWNGTSHRLEVEGTKTEVNSHLASMEWWSRGPSDSFTIDITVDRNIESAGYVNVATSNDIVFNAGTAPDTYTDDPKTYDEDKDSSFNVVNPPRTLDIFGTKTYTVNLSLRNSGDTADSSDGIFINSNNGGATVNNNNTRDIQFVGLSNEVNTAIENTVFRPNADVTGNYGVKWTQTDDNPTPGSNPFNDFMTMSLNLSHNEYSINGAQSYDEDTIKVWNLGSITDERPDHINAGILYDLTLTVSDPSAIVSIANWTDQGSGVYTFSGNKTNCNVELASIEITPAADYVGSYTITYQQDQTTDTLNQGSSIVSFSVSQTHAEFSITTSLTYSTDTTANWIMGGILDLRPDNIDSNIQYELTLKSNDNIGTLTNWTELGALKTSVVQGQSGVPGDEACMSRDGNYVAFLQDAGQTLLTIYERTGLNSWSLQQSIFTTSIGNPLGIAIDSDGDTIAVGFPQEQFPEYNGVVYTYTRSGSTWTQEDILEPPQGFTEGWFGRSIQLSDDGNVMVIGMPSEDNASDEKSYIYRRSGSTWSLDETLQKSLPQTGTDDFGFSVALSGDGTVAVIGAPGSNNFAGSITIFSESGTSWPEEQVIVGAANTQSGYCVAISGDGTRIAFVDNTNKVHIYSRSGGVSTLEQSISTPSYLSNTQRRSITFNTTGDKILISYGNGTDISNTAKMYRRTGSTWLLEGTFAPDVAGESWYGSLSYMNGAGDEFVVGAADTIYIFSNELFRYRFTGTKSECNTELSSVEHTPLAGDTKDYTLEYTQTQTTDSVDQGSTTITVTNV